MSPSGHYDNRTVARRNSTPFSPNDEVSAADYGDILIDDQPLDPPQSMVLMLNKPVGYTCSTKDIPPLVYELLPPRFRLRSPLLSPVGRLDRDTSGLLLMTDDGPLLHRIISPKSKQPKVYEAVIAEPLRGDESRAVRQRHPDAGIRNRTARRRHAESNRATTDSRHHYQR